MVDFWGGVVHTEKRKSEDSDSRLRDNNNLSSKLSGKPPTLFHSVLHSGNEFLNELQSKLNAALTFDEEEDEETDSRDEDEEEYEEEEVAGASSSAASEVTGIGRSFLTEHRLLDATVCSHRRHSVSELPSDRPACSRFVLTSRTSRHRRSKQETSKTSSSSSSKSRIAPQRRNVTTKARYRRSDVHKARSDTVSSTESASEAECGIEGTRLPSASESSSFSLGNSASEGSLLSWTSSLSCDSQTEEGTAECMQFMKQFVEKLFKNNNSITLEEKAKFGELCQTEVGRLWFSRYVNTQRVNNRRVDESTFYSLVQYFAIILFECSEADDYTPAKTLMNMCFTYYHELSIPGCAPCKEFLYLYLREQSIWQSLRFWNAAFFDAVQCERAHKPVVTREDVEQYSPEEIVDEQAFQENITFGQLGSFTCNMHAFGLNRELCLEFLRKQAIIANLRQEQVKMLRENIERMYQ